MSGESDRRQWPRIPAALLSNVTASIMAGPDVRLVNLSRGGALMEVAARYPMRSKVRLKLTRASGEVTQVPGMVSWAKVGSIVNGKINYLLAVIFEKHIEDLTAATGIEDIEKAALAATASDPDYGDEEIHAVQSSAPEEPAVTSAAALADAAPTSLFIEEDLSESIFAARDTLTSFPTPATTPGVDAAAARKLEDRAELAVAEARMAELRADERAASEAAALSAANDNLSAQLQAYDEERIALRSDLEAARQRWEEEKSGLTADVVTTLARVNELEAALEQHRQSGGQALADQQALAQTLSMRLEALEGERASLRTELSGERQRWEEDRAALMRDAAEAVARANALQEALQRREQDQDQGLAEARTLQQVLQSRLEAVDAERDQWTTSLETERRGWQEERAALEQAIAAAAAQAAELTATFERRAHEQGQALAEARDLHASLQSRVDSLDAERDQWTTSLETERRGWQEERAALGQAIAAAAAQATELKATFDRREHEHRQALTAARDLHASLQSRLDALDVERREWTVTLEALDGERAGWITQQQQWQHDREHWQHERTTLAQEAAGAHARVTLLEQTLQSRQDDHARTLAEQQAAALSLAARVESLDAEHLETRRELEAERARRDDDRVHASAELAARAEEFQAALEAREQIHAGAIAEQQTNFEGLIAELMQTANDQQAEYQQLMAECTAALEEQVTRVERAHAELARVRAEAGQQHAALDQRCRELAAQLEAAEAVTVAQETRYRAIRQEAERLVGLLASPVQAQLPVDDVADFRASGQSAQAVAGG